VVAEGALQTGGTFRADTVLLAEKAIAAWKISNPSKRKAMSLFAILRYKLFALCHQPFAISSVFACRTA
jgi:hypothetical protein